MLPPTHLCLALLFAAQMDVSSILSLVMPRRPLKRERKVVRHPRLRACDHAQYTYWRARKCSGMHGQLITH